MNRATPFSTRLRRLRWAWRLNFGRLGLAALAVLVAAAVLSAVVRPALAQAQATALREQTEREQAAARVSQARLTASLRDPREDWLDALPADKRRGVTMVKLMKLLHASPLAADTADYVAEAQEPGLLRVRVTVPLNGSYGQTRKLVASILDGLPNAALDALELEQQADDEQALSGQMRLSLFFRRSAR